MAKNDAVLVVVFLAWRIAGVPVVEASCFVNYYVTHAINGKNDIISFDGGSDLI
jgi:hypothetical protein